MPTKTTRFTARQIAILRGRAGKASAMPEPRTEGWSKCAADPMRLLAVFRTLRIREGYVLRAYQYFTGGNGNTVVWALPADAEFPEPARYEDVRGLFDAPRPPKALERAMQAIEGDGTPRSYLSASLFLRELGEFGAFWHGCDWSTRTIADTDSTIDDPDAWQWSELHPVDWRPCVTESSRGVRVTFYSSGALGGRTVYRHVDRYRRGNYDFDSQRTQLAFGGGGFLF